MFNRMAGPRRRQSWSWYGFAATVVAAVATIGLLLVVVSHRDSQLPTAKDCPRPRWSTGAWERTSRRRRR